MSPKRGSGMFSRDRAVVVLVDYQEKLLRAMCDKESLLENAVKLAQGAKALGVPLIRSEQNPQGLGRTVPELEPFLADSPPVEKISFSCVGEPEFMKRLEASGRSQVVLAGIESHVCMYQTAADLRAKGFQVAVPADAVSSRTPANRAIGLDLARNAGCVITSVEAILFELMAVAEGPEFKALLKIVK
jgi:nicotinamidase-related amidase